MTHIILLLLSIPLIVVQVKVLRQLATENPFSYVHAEATVDTLEDYERMLLGQAGDSLYAHDFHRDSDFVLTEEMAGFIQELKEKWAVEEEEYEKRPTHVMMAKAEGAEGDDELRNDYKKLPFVILSKEEQEKLKEYSKNGRYDTELTEQLLKYAASVLNMDPNEGQFAQKNAFYNN